MFSPSTRCHSNSISFETLRRESSSTSEYGSSENGQQIRQLKIIAATCNGEDGEVEDVMEEPIEWGRVQLGGGS